MKDRGAKIIIGDFYEAEARKVMCQAFKSGMTQKEGYVWLLPGWFKERWYDIDKLRLKKRHGYLQNKIGNNAVPIRISDDIGIGDLPDCSTGELIQVLNGHFSLVHRKYAPADDIMETGRTVADWKAQLETDLKNVSEEYQKRMERMNVRRKIKNKKVLIKMNHNSGYVYDAVWLYAQALQELVRLDETFLQNLHSNRSVAAFVDIIKKIDFNGVSGRINFFGRSSRLSDIDIIQWGEDLNRTVIKPIIIGLYKPNYISVSENGSSEQNTLTVEEEKISWYTQSGEKPVDDNTNCWILSSLAIFLGLDCQYSLAMTFLVGFVILLFASGFIFLIIKRR